MHNPPPSQKPELPIWVWALIGSGGTLLLFLAGYAIWSLTTSKSPESSYIVSVGQKSEDTNPLFPITQNGKIGFIDRNGKIAIPPQFDSMSALPPNKSIEANVFPEGLMAVSISGKWGYIDKTGKVVIQPQFETATNFSDGLAWVQMQNTQGSNPLQGFIDKSGKLLINLPYSEKQKNFSYFSEGFTPISDESSISYIDKSGKIVLNKKFDFDVDNRPVENDRARLLIGSYHFSEGLACGRINGNYGCIDTNGQFVIPAKYDYIGRFSEGLAVVKIGDNWGYLNKNNEIAIPLQFDFAHIFSEGLAAVRVSNKLKYINKSGKIVINPPFDSKIDCGSSNFSGGFASGKFENGKCGAIDKNGVVIISPQFVDISNFANGFVLAISADQVSKDQAVVKQNYIDKNGKTIYTEETKVERPVRK